MIRVGIATMPERENSLRKTLESLAPQGVEFYLWFNNRVLPPEWISEFPVAQAICDADNYGDRGKFMFEQEGICFSCDDDIIYPDDYIEKTIDNLSRYDNEVIGSYHGKHVFPNMRSYYRQARTHHYMKDVKYDHKVNIPGTGVMAWDADRVTFEESLFEEPNMADIYVGIHAQIVGLQVVCFSHEEGWFDTVYHSDSIWENEHKSDERQTKLVNSRSWK